MCIKKLIPALSLALIAFVCVSNSADLIHAQAAVAEKPQEKKKEALPSVETVMDKYIEVTGGLENYQALKNMSSKGTIEIPMAGISGKVNVVQDFEKGRFYSVANLKGVGKEESGCDGETCWQISPMQGGAMLMTGGQADQAKEQGTMENTYDYKNYYKDIKVVGEEKVGKENCYKLVFTKQNDSKETKYFSAESGLQLKSQMKVESPMGAMKVDVMVDSYGKVGDFMMPTKITQALPNGMKIEISMKPEDMKLNSEIEDKTFELPKSVAKLKKDSEEKK